MKVRHRKISTVDKTLTWIAKLPVAHVVFLMEGRFFFISFNFIEKLLSCYRSIDSVSWLTNKSIITRCKLTFFKMQTIVSSIVLLSWFICLVILFALSRWTLVCHIKDDIFRETKYFFGCGFCGHGIDKVKKYLLLCWGWLETFWKSKVPCTKVARLYVYRGRHSNTNSQWCFAKIGAWYWTI